MNFDLLLKSSDGSIGRSQIASQIESFKRPANCTDQTKPRAALCLANVCSFSHLTFCMCPSQSLKFLVQSACTRSAGRRTVSRRWCTPAIATSAAAPRWTRAWVREACWRICLTSSWKTSARRKRATTTTQEAAPAAEGNASVRPQLKTFALKHWPKDVWLL